MTGMTDKCAAEGGCKPVKDIMDKLKSYSRTGILILITIGGSYAFTWLNASGVPELKEDNKKHSEAITVLQTNQQMVMKNMEKIIINQDEMIKSLTKIATKLEVDDKKATTQQ